MGPARSGSGVHIDPLATSAWNALLRGHKRWALFPPGTARGALRPPGSDREAAAWFATVFRDMLRAGPAGRATGPQGAEPAGPAPPSPPARSPGVAAAEPSLPCAQQPCAPHGLVQGVQGPGDTIFVPAGWWHAVLNLDDTLAVTQNFCSSVGFARVWRHTRRGRPKMSARWLERLRQARPDLAAQADAAEARPEDGAHSASSSSSSSSGSSSDGGSSSSSPSSSDDEDSKEVGQKSAVVKRQRLDGVAETGLQVGHDAPPPTTEGEAGLAPKVDEELMA